jgi:hypothetical protein
VTQATLEFVLNSMYAAIVTAMNEHQRAFANDTLSKCADLNCAPPLAPEILRRIARNAVNQGPPTRPQLKVINGGVA